MSLIARHGRVNLRRPGVEPAGKGLRLLKALLPQPRRHMEGAHPVMADRDDALFRVKFGVSAGRYIPHGHAHATMEKRNLCFPGFADIEENKGRSIRALSQSS